MNKKLKHSIIFIFSLVLLCATLFVSGLAKDAEELKSVKFGLPLAFVSQDFSSNGGFQYFPQYLKFKVSWPIDFKIYSFLNLLISLLAFFLSLEILVYILEWLDFKIRNLIFKEKK